MCGTCSKIANVITPDRFQLTNTGSPARGLHLHTVHSDENHEIEHVLTSPSMNVRLESDTMKSLLWREGVFIYAQVWVNQTKPRTARTPPSRAGVGFVRLMRHSELRSGRVASHRSAMWHAQPQCPATSTLCRSSTPALRCRWTSAALVKYLRSAPYALRQV